MITEKDIYKEYSITMDAAKRLNVNDSRIRQLCIAGRFHGAFKLGETWLIPRKSVENFTRLPRGAKPKTAKRPHDSEIIANTLATLQEQETQHDQQ